MIKNTKKKTSALMRINAFTLIELLVVVGIIGLLSASIFIGAGAPKRTTALNRAAREIALTVRDAQNRSVTTVVGLGGISPCGFGIAYQDEDEIILYKESTFPVGQDCAATSTPGGLAQNIDRIYTSLGGYGTDSVLETIRLTENNQVKFLSNFADIYFEPPDGLTYLDGVHNNQIASSTDIIICLRSNCSGYQKTVRVYLGGNVEIIN
jgi:prepilin-type N-terminal cleavage/methylation domain-containing protein